MRSRDHDTDPFPPQGSRAESSNQANAGQDGVQDIAATISLVSACRCGRPGGGDSLTPWFETGQAWLTHIYTAHNGQPTPAVPYVYTRPSGAGCFWAASTTGSAMISLAHNWPPHGLFCYARRGWAVHTEAKISKRIIAASRERERERERVVR